MSKKLLISCLVLLYSGVCFGEATNSRKKLAALRFKKQALSARFIAPYSNGHHVKQSNDESFVQSGQSPIHLKAHRLHRKVPHKKNDTDFDDEEIAAELGAQHQPIKAPEAEYAPPGVEEVPEEEVEEPEEEVAPAAAAVPIPEIPSQKQGGVIVNVVTVPRIEQQAPIIPAAPIFPEVPPVVHPPEVVPERAAQESPTAVAPLTPQDLTPLVEAIKGLQQPPTIPEAATVPPPPAPTPLPTPEAQPAQEAPLPPPPPPPPPPSPSTSPVVITPPPAGEGSGGGSHKIEIENNNCNCGGNGEGSEFDEALLWNRIEKLSEKLEDLESNPS